MPVFTKVRHDAAPARLFYEAAHVVLTVRDDKAVAERLRTAAEGERRRGVRGDMRGKQRAEVHITGRVAAYDEEVLIPEEIRAVFHAAGRAEGSCSTRYCICTPKRDPSPK